MLIKTNQNKKINKVPGNNSGTNLNFLCPNTYSILVYEIVNLNLEFQNKFD